ncbi:hypothetical protein M8C21_014098 [Ambrosia artemisiifolia]|uniref:Uncharacterized protein n=1 Tax=Ambrosia artemisiifolia TaxID=4212 RepID=A0AAD5D9S3_AMBAR|nr:hypothetical protein M8C21_014098 [Ambrosia artemisiifolia]
MELNNLTNLTELRLDSNYSVRSVKKALQQGRQDLATVVPNLKKTGLDISYVWHLF